MSDSGLSAFGFCPTCGRGGQVRAVWREAVHVVHRLAANRTYATNSFLAFDPWFGVPSEWKRAISRGPWNRAMAPFQYSSTRMVLLAKRCRVRLGGICMEL